MVYNTQYAPVSFNGNTVITLGQFDEGGAFPNQTFHAIDPTEVSNTYSDHAYSVGGLMYGPSTVAYQYVTDIYCDGYDSFLNNVVNVQNSTGIATAPGNFQSGVKVVNCSWVTDYTAGEGGNTTTTDTDALRRIDYMTNIDNVTFIAAAVTDPNSVGADYRLPWGSFNSLAVSGTQPFNPAGGAGKQHADLYINAQASDSTAVVSQYATALYGVAQTAGQTDAMQNAVSRSLLMAGADKTLYNRQTVNNLDGNHGAGEPNYTRSLAILQAGESALINASSGSVTAAPSTAAYGWTYGTVGANGQDVILFNNTLATSSVTASLNWNVTSPITGSNINTALQTFANLTLQVVPVTTTGNGTYTLGATQTNALLYSRATGDNVQYIYDPTALAPGTYAFVINNTSSVVTPIGLSYALTYATQWNRSSGGSWGTASNWTMGIPNAQGASANFDASPGLTASGVITLDGNRTVGQINFSNINSYNISSGSGGTLTIDDTGDPAGSTNPPINVFLGNQIISAPIVIASGLTMNVSAGASLTIAAYFNGSGFAYKAGPGSLILSNTFNVAASAFEGGTTTLTPSGSLLQGPIYIESGAVFTFGASTGSSVLVRNVPLTINAITGGVVKLAPAASTASRQLLVASSSISIGGTTNAWTGTIDLANNDADVAPGSPTIFESLAVATNQIQQGFNNGKWNGSGGIISSSAAADTAHLTTLGIIQNNQGGTPLYTSSNLFDGIMPGVSDILIKYTYFGDTNLDGKVDGSDYSRVDNGFLNHLTSFYNGDFNYDGVVNGSDYTLIDNAFNGQGASLKALTADPTSIVTSQAEGASVVPEPASLAVILTSSFGLLARRKRRLNYRIKSDLF